MKMLIFTGRLFDSCNPSEKAEFEVEDENLSSADCVVMAANVLENLGTKNHRFVQKTKAAGQYMNQNGGNYKVSLSNLGYLPRWTCDGLFGSWQVVFSK